MLSRVELAFSDAQKALASLRRLIGPNSDDEEDTDTDDAVVFEEEDYDELLAKLEALIQSSNNSVPIWMVIEAMHKIWENSNSRDGEEWIEIIMILTDILGNETDIEIMSPIIEFLFDVSNVFPIPLLRLGSVNALFSNIDDLTMELWLKVLGAVRKLLDNINNFQDSERNFLISQTNCAFNALAKLLGDNSLSNEDAGIATRCLMTLLEFYDASEIGVEIIFTSSMFPSIMSILKSVDLDKIMFLSIYEMVAIMCRRSNILRRMIIEKGIFKEIINHISLTGLVSNRNDALQRAFEVPIEFAKNLKKLNHKTGLQVAKDLVYIIMNIAPFCDAQTRSKPFIMYKALFSNLNLVQSLQLLTETSLVFNIVVLASQLKASNLEHVDNVCSMIKQWLDMPAERVSDLFGMYFQRAGGFYVLERLSKCEILKEKFEEILDLYEEKFRFYKHPSNAFMVLSQILGNKQEENGTNLEETVISILESLKTGLINEDGMQSVTCYEFLISGVVDALLEYFYKDGKVPSPGMKRKRLDFNEFDYDEVLGNKIKALILKCKEKYQDTILWSRLLDDLTYRLQRSMFFLQYRRFRPIENPKTCYGSIRYALEKKDPRHSLLLLLSVIERASRLGPCIEARLIADTLVDDFSDSDKEFLKATMKQYRFSAMPPEVFTCKITHDINTIMLKCCQERSEPLPPWAFSIFKSYPFAFSYNMRKSLYDTRQKPQGGEVTQNAQEVERENLIKTGKTAMKKHLEHVNGDVEENRKNAKLMIIFKGESGQGPGPTKEFFSIIGNAFLEQEPHMWRENEEKSLLFARPYDPESPDLPQVLDNFRFLGQVMAKALKDGRLLDINLSIAFYKLFILHKALNIYDILSFDERIGSTLFEMEALGRKYRNSQKVARLGDKENQSSPCSFKCLGLELEDLCQDYSVPGNEDLQLSLDKDTQVLPDNVEGYVKDVVEAMVSRGVKKQVEAFSEGFEEIMRLVELQIFNPEEMEMLFCGEGVGEEWSHEMLGRALVFEMAEDMSGEETLEWKNRVIDVISELDNKQKVLFLKFVTSHGRLPQGGLEGLTPRICVTLYRRTDGPSPIALPTAMTCANTIYIHRYPDKATLKEKIIKAISGDGYFAFL